MSILKTILTDNLLQMAVILQQSLSERNFDTERVGNSIVVKRGTMVYVLDVRIEAYINSTGLVISEKIDIIWRNKATSERGFKQISNDLSEILINI